MSNVLAALGGAAAGIASGIQQNRMFNMQKVLAQAELASQGGAPTLAAPDPDDPTAGGSASGSNGGGVMAPPSPAAGLMTGNPMASAPAAAAAPGGLPAGSGNVTQGGTAAAAYGGGVVNPEAGNATQAGVSGVPTNQADVINLARAAQSGPSPSASGAPTGALAALNGASKVGASATPVGADPIGGANSGLIASVLAPPKMVPVGNVGGQAWSVPQGMAPAQLQGRSAVLNALLQGGLQSQQQQFAAGQEEKGETFARGQQQAGFTQQTGMQTAEIASQQKIANQNAEIRRMELEKQLQQMEIMFGFKQTAQTNKAMEDITKPLEPLEKQATLITHAQDALTTAGNGDPAAVKSALTDAFVAMGPGGQARLTPQLIGVSGGAAGGSISDQINRAATMIATGKVPPNQLANMQAALGAELQSVQKQYHGVAVAGVANHPEIDVADGLKRVSAREGAFFPQTATGPGAMGGLQQQAAAAIARGADPRMVAARLKQMQSQQATAAP